MSSCLRCFGEQAGDSCLRHQDCRAHLFIHCNQTLDHCTIDDTGGETDPTRTVADINPIPVAGVGGLKGLAG